MTANSYLRQRLRQWVWDHRVRKGAEIGLCFGAGFLLSAASLANSPQPLAMALVSMMTGWHSPVMGLGAAVGYLVFWDQRGLQGVVWTVLAGLTGLLLGKRKLIRQGPWLIPAFCGLYVAATGLLFLILYGDTTSIGIYLLRVTLSIAGSRLFWLVRQRRGPFADWIGEGVGVLALAQVAPFPWLGLGYMAAGALASAEAFPAAALAGLALDLARISRVPMTAVLCAMYLIRLIPGIPAWMRRVLPGGAYLLVMSLCGVRDYRPVIPFVLGGMLSVFLPQRPQVAHRRGETGVAQVRLEVMAGVLGQTQRLLTEVNESPIDEEALMARIRDRCCASCPSRKNCRRSDPLPVSLLHGPLPEAGTLPFPCRKPGRMILELRRTREQYRLLRGDRDRQREYRAAVVQQYRFLSEYLQTLADQLPRRGERLVQRYRPEIGIAVSGKEPANGDKIQHFYGPGCRFYILLCDGMGTGIGAAEEGRTAADMLRHMLSAGFPAEHALGSLNSLLALRSRAGAVTVDLAEIRLDTGSAVLYKWGAMPSCLIREGRAEKIGTAGPPPGIDLLSARESVERLSLRKGEMLILLSDGVEGEEIRRVRIGPGEPPGELAAKLLGLGAAESQDDATVAVIRLHPEGLST